MAVSHKLCRILNHYSFECETRKFAANPLREVANLGNRRRCHFCLPTGRHFHFRLVRILFPASAATRQSSQAGFEFDVIRSVLSKVFSLSGYVFSAVRFDSPVQQVSGDLGRVGTR